MQPMSEPMTLTPTKLSPRDQSLMKVHSFVADAYKQGPTNLTRWSESDARDLQNRAIQIAETVGNAHVIPPSREVGKTPLVVSVSANTGVIEKELANKLGSDFHVFAGDIASVQRVGSCATPLRLDASFLPFANESVAAILDIKGAIWHEAGMDVELKSSSAENLLDIFSRLREKLQTGGVIIVDDNEIANPKLPVTGAEIDKALTISGKQIDGFDVQTIGKGDGRLRVYKKPVLIEYPTPTSPAL